MGDTLNAVVLKVRGVGLSSMRAYMTMTDQFVGKDTGIIQLDATDIGNTFLIGASLGGAARRAMQQAATDMQANLSIVAGFEINFLANPDQPRMRIDFTLPPLVQGRSGGPFAIMGIAVTESFKTNFLRSILSVLGLSVPGLSVLGLAEINVGNYLENNIGYEIYKSVASAPGNTAPGNTAPGNTAPGNTDKPPGNTDKPPGNTDKPLLSPEVQKALEDALQPFNPVLNNPLLFVTGILFVGGAMLLLQGVGKKGSVSGGGVTVVSSNPYKRYGIRRRYARLSRV